MTHAALVPALDLVADLIDGRLTHREALAILRAKGMTADIEALGDAVHFQRRLLGLAEGTIDPLLDFPDGWHGAFGSCLPYTLSRAEDWRDEALERLALPMAVSA